jgi:hypothetical protein
VGQMSTLLKVALMSVGQMSVALLSVAKKSRHHNSLKNQPQMILWADRFSNQCNLNKKKVNFAQMVFGKSTIPLSTTSFKKTKTFSIKNFILDKQSINY